MKKSASDLRDENYKVYSMRKQASRVEGLAPS